MTTQPKIERVIRSISTGTSADQLEVEFGDVDLDEAGELGRTPLMVAASQGLLSVAELLVRHGASVQTTGIRQMTPLHEAASNGQAAMVKYLLYQGAQVDAETTDGATPLMCAAAWGSIEVLQLLLKSGANRTKTDRTGSTASEIAREKGEDQSAELIDSYAGLLD